MREMLQNKEKLLKIAVAILVAVVSIFGLAGPMSSVEFHQNTLDALEEKQTTVLELSAASTAASAAITLIPGDTATPIANELADLSSHFMVVLCAIFLEKYLLTITGSVTFSILIPAACLLYVLYLLLNWGWMRTLATKLLLFGLLIVAVIPVSVYITDRIEDTYQESIQSTIETAKETTDAIQNESETEEDTEEKGFLSGIISSVTDGVSNAVSGVTDKAGEMVNNFIEALAVMAITCCVIPVLVLLSFVWLAKALLAVELPVSYGSFQGKTRDQILAQQQKLRKLRVAHTRKG